MKTLNVVSAKSIWLVGDLSDLNPRGKDVASELIEWLKDNYHFTKAPASASDLDPASKSLKFEGGRFMAKEEIYVQVDLEMFNDGFVGNSRSSTRDTDQFLEDVLTTTAKEFSLQYSPDLVKAKLYTSELTVRLDHPLSHLSPRLVQFADKISDACGYKGIPRFAPTGITFGIDLYMSVLKLSEFRIEPRVGFPFSEHRYWAKAPLQTDVHETFLAEFENILASGLA